MTTYRDILATARSSGRCPPNLIADDRTIDGDGFGSVVGRLLDNGFGLALGTHASAVDEFETAIKMSQSVNSIPRDGDNQGRILALEQRRCILLAIIGSTPSTNTVLKHILSNGFLVVVKAWLDDILKESVGKIDLLLHLLTSVTTLPVTKEMVTSSKLGKAIAAVEKHKICVGGKNEGGIKARISQVKEEWSASVKINKYQNGLSTKRPLPSTTSKGESSLTHPSNAKKAKKDDHSWSSLLKKVTLPGELTSTGKSSSDIPHVGNVGSTLSAAHTARLKAQEHNAKLKERLANKDATSMENPNDQILPSPTKEQLEQHSSSLSKDSRRIKWADSNGGDLLVLQKAQLNPNYAPDDVKNKPVSNNNEEKGCEDAGPVSWSDRRKRDRLREKELLQKARKSKIVDKEDNLNAMMMMVSPWHKPYPRTPDPEFAPVQAVSKEVTAQASRMITVMPASYLSEADVPSNPAPLNEIEQALDLTSQSSTVAAAIPFFVPQQEPETTVPSLALMPSQQHVAALSMPGNTLVPPTQIPTGATVEMVQSMGLPLFLAGSNVQALQTLAATPSLLNTFVDANGILDQVRLMNLVQNLTPSHSQTIGQPQIHVHGAAIATGYHVPGQVAQIASQYGPAQTSLYESPPQSSTYGPESHGPESHRSRPQGEVYRGDQNGSDGNVHISGYGPGTTPSEVIALFAPYVHVDEVVMKGTFAFVNTSDAGGAKRAREALNGALLGGTPVRINMAVRRAKDPTRIETRAVQKSQVVRSEAAHYPGMIWVRDDRGNPATKNLFVAGYGTGTSEQDLQDIFSQHSNVIGVVMKTTFSFVNTSDRMAAVHAREALIGSVINGGVLRINFAKESGRLGTSFDSTYGPASQQRYMRRPVY